MTEVAGAVRKVEYLVAPPGTIQYAGNHFRFPGGKQAVTALHVLWSPQLALLPANADRPIEQWAITARHVAEHALTQLGQAGDGGQVIPAQWVVEREDAEGNLVAAYADPVTKETRWQVLQKAADRQPKKKAKAKAKPEPAPEPAIPPELASALEEPLAEIPEPEEPEEVEAPPTPEPAPSASRRHK